MKLAETEDGRREALLTFEAINTLLKGLRNTALDHAEYKLFVSIVESNGKIINSLSGGLVS